MNGKLFMCFFLYVACGLNLCYGQTTIDSLKANIFSARDETARINALISLCSKWDSFSEDSLQVYNQQLRKLSTKWQNKKGLQLSSFYDAVYLLQKNKVDSALVLTEKGFADYRRQFSYDNMYLQYYRLKGNILLRMARYEDVSKLNFDLLQEAEKNDDLSGIALAYLGLGNVENRLQKKAEALQWYFKALHSLNTDSARQKMSYLFNNMAIVYYKLNQPDSALYYVEQGVKYSKQSGNLTDYANALSLYGGILAEFNQTGKAEILFKDALEVRKKIGDVYYVVTDMAQFALFYLNTGQPKKGIELCLEGLQYQQQNGTIAGYSELYQSLARNYKAAGLYKESTETMERYLSLRDSVYQKNSADLMAELQTRYEVQKKENTIIQQKLDLARKNAMIYSIAAVLLVTIMSGILFFRHRRRLQQVRLQQLEAEQKQKTTQAVMQAENDERKRIAEDLHDSVAQKMVVAKMNLETLRPAIHNFGDKEKQIFKNTGLLLEEAATEVRELSHSMMPHYHAQNGLTIMIRDFLDKLQRPDLSIQFNADGDFSGLTESKSLMIYRIIQEAVQNVWKHAKASRLDISIIGEPHALEMTVEDNGKGFDPNGVAINSMGIRNIRTRTAYLGGTIDLQSEPGKGTVLVFYFPL